MGIYVVAGERIVTIGVLYGFWSIIGEFAKRGGVTMALIRFSSGVCKYVLL